MRDVADVGNIVYTVYNVYSVYTVVDDTVAVDKSTSRIILTFYVKETTINWSPHKKNQLGCFRNSDDSKMI